MVRPKDRFLIDTAFLIESTHKSFFGAPLLTSHGEDHTFVFGFARDFLRMRRRLGIRDGMLVIGKESHSLTSEQHNDDVITFLQRLEIPYLHDPLYGNLQIASSLGSQFSHIVTADRRLLQLSSDDLAIVLLQKGRRGQHYSRVHPD